MIKTDYIYTEKQRNIKIIIPINTNNTNNTNNILPLFIEANNNDKNIILLKKNNDNFNNYKYSLFIPILSYLINNFSDVININYLTNINGNEKTFNIISYKNKINIVITFKKGSTNKKKFKNAFYKAYNSLINTIS